MGGGKGLVVPVLRDADRMSFADIELAIADLAGRARENKLELEELQGGTFTITNGGIYGSMLYSVGQMHREIGIRIALGAGRRRVVAMIVRTGLALTIAGITLGLGGAYALSRTLESFVFGLTTTDTPTFAAVAVLLGAVAMASCYLPARRAAATDPIETLRSD